MRKPGPVVHPRPVRITHWINAVAMPVMIGSGLEIHNAHPILPFRVPEALTIGGWLGGATRWHFAAMWLLVANGLVYLAHGHFGATAAIVLFLAVHVAMALLVPRSLKLMITGR